MRYELAHRGRITKHMDTMDVGDGHTICFIGLGNAYKVKVGAVVSLG